MLLDHDFSPRRRAALAIGVAFAMGCGSNPPPSVIVDGSVIPDTSKSDGQMVDAADGETPDAGPADGDVPEVECTVGAAVDVVEFVGVPANVELDLAASGAGAMLVVGGALVDDYPGNQVFAYHFAGATVSAGAPLASSTNGGARFPTVVARGAGYLAGWSDTLGMGVAREIVVRGVDGSGVAMGAAPTRLTFNSSADEHLALATVASGSLALSQNGATTNAGVIDGANALGDVTSIEGSTGIRGRTVLSAIGTTTFAAYRAADGRVRTASVAADASSGGASNAVSTSTSTGASFDFAGYDDDGAIVFEEVISGIRTEVHFRPLGANGSASLSEPVLSGAIAEGHTPSLGKIGGGYIVAYRHEEGGVITLRLLLVDQFGNIVGSDDGPTLVGIEGDIRVRVANDGTPYVVYEEPVTVEVPGIGSMSGTVVRYLQVTCS